MEMQPILDGRVQAKAKEIMMAEVNKFSYGPEIKDIAFLTSASIVNAYTDTRRVPQVHSLRLLNDSKNSNMLPVYTLSFVLDIEESSFSVFENSEFEKFKLDFPTSWQGIIAEVVKLVLPPNDRSMLIMAITDAMLIAYEQLYNIGLFSGVNLRILKEKYNAPIPELI